MAIGFFVNGLFKINIEDDVLYCIFKLISFLAISKKLKVVVLSFWCKIKT